MAMRRRLACCTREREISLDFDEQERFMRYDGLENCILKSQTHDNESTTSRESECATGSLDDADSSSSSSKVGFRSFSSKWSTLKTDKHDLDEWELKEKPCHFYVNKELTCSTQFSDVAAMKEKFANLLLGEDITGGSNGLSSALALSNAITTLAATVFGEMWKLEPLPEERKSKWRREMEWLLSPTNHMIELVPTKQNGANGRILEIMTPKSRADIQMNLPALQKLDSMLIETLDSMESTEFWYAEVGDRGVEGMRSKSSGRDKSSKKWWLPMPQVPEGGLSDPARKKLINQGRLVHQILKAARLINQTVLLEMPVPTIIRDALPKSGKASLSEDLYKVLTEESSSAKEVLNCLNIESQNAALEVTNKLEAAAFSWGEKIRQLERAIRGTNSVAPNIRTSWANLNFIKDPMAEVNKLELLQQRAEVIVQQLKTRYPNLPQTFLDVTKVQYGKDIGHSILEAYSRVLGNLAFSILCRIGDVLQEDVNALSNNPNVVSDTISSSTSSCFLESTWCSESATSSTYSDCTNACDLN